LKCGFKYIKLFILMIAKTPKILYITSITLSPLWLFLIITNKNIIIEWTITLTLSINIKLNILLEWRRIIYSSIIIFISRNVIRFSKIYINKNKNNLRFTYILLCFILSINILIMIPNIICLLIGWDGLGITSFILIIFYNNSRSMRAAILTIITNRLGDTFLLIAIIIRLDRANFTPINKARSNLFTSIICLGIIIAAITKSAQFPYSSW